jgi:hypothetical protein
LHLSVQNLLKVLLVRQQQQQQGRPQAAVAVFQVQRMVCLLQETAQTVAAAAAA